MFIIKVLSEMTGNLYEAEDVIWYGNALQAAQYKIWGVLPVDIDVSSETKKWIFAFTKEDHRRLIKRWNEQKAGKNKGGNYE